MNASAIESFSDYLGLHPPKVQTLLKKLRATIRKAAPAALEKISYGLPTFTLHRNLVHFGAFKEHLGFYPGPTVIAAFKKELSSYESAKGSVQFPFTKPLPCALIERIVKFQVEQDLVHFKKKKKKKKS